MCRTCRTGYMFIGSDLHFRQGSQGSSYGRHRISIAITQAQLRPAVSLLYLSLCDQVSLEFRRTAQPHVCSAHNDTNDSGTRRCTTHHELICRPYNPWDICCRPPAMLGSRDTYWITSGLAHWRARGEKPHNLTRCFYCEGMQQIFCLA